MNSFIIVCFLPVLCFNYKKTQKTCFPFLLGKIYLSCKTFVVLKFLFQIHYTQSVLYSKILHLLINPFINNMPDVIYHMSKDSYSNVCHPIGTVQWDLLIPQERISHSHYLESGLALWLLWPIWNSESLVLKLQTPAWRSTNSFCLSTLGSPNESPAGKQFSYREDPVKRPHGEGEALKLYIKRSPAVPCPSWIQIPANLLGK